MSKPKLAVICDSPYAKTGFGNVAFNILTRLEDKYDIAILAINYSGDWFQEQNRFRLYHTGNHIYGFNKIEYFLKREMPDCLFVIQDPFVADKIITKVRTIAPELKSILYCPVDSPNVPHKYVNPLNQYNSVITYTQFGKTELEVSGLTVPCHIIPHGIEQSLFFPVDKLEAREFLGIPDDGRYIVGYTATNQPRKKIDVWLYTINRWLNKYPHDNVYAYYHGQLQRPQGLDIPQYIQYLDRINAKVGAEHRLEDRFMATSDDPSFVVHDNVMRYIYNSFDVLFHAAANGGWEMPVHESLACGVPVIAPDFSAVGEWGKEGGVFFVPVTDTPDAVTSGANTEHHTLDVYWTVEALETLYQNATLREELGNRGYEIATQDKFSWNVIANQFSELLKGE